MNLFDDNIEYALVAAKFWSSRTAIEFDDCHQLAYIGLFKASKTYNKDNQTSFKTWAHTHINNEIKTYLKRLKSKVQTCAMPVDEDGNEIDIIGDVDDGYEYIEDKLIIEKASSEIKKVLTCKEWNIFYATSILGYDQYVIAKVLGVQQPHVSRLLKKIRSKVIESGFNSSTFR